MIYFKMKQYSPDQVDRSWKELPDWRSRTSSDFSFDGCDYKINGKIYSQFSSDFCVALMNAK